MKGTEGGPDGPLRILLVGDRKSGKTTCCMTAARMLREKGLRPGAVVCPKLLDRAGEVIGIKALNLLDDPPSREVLARTDRRMDGPSTSSGRVLPGSCAGRGRAASFRAHVSGPGSPARVQSG